MLERRSPLATAHPYRSPVLKIGEAPGFSLVQLSGEAASMAKAIGPLPEKVGVALVEAGRTLLRIGPNQFWVVGPEGDDLTRKLESTCTIVVLNSSRCRILLEGEPARDVLAKGIATDFHPQVFLPGAFAMTGVHHMPVLVHCISEHSFHLYAMRTLALGVYEWLCDAALEYA